jgi:hypothetical protein
MDGKFYCSNKFIYNASNPHRNILFTNTKEIEPCDVPYENLTKKIKKKC